MLSALEGVDLIVHAGDVGKPEVLEQLGELAPVQAIRGNIDVGCWAQQLPEMEVVEVEEAFLCVVHDLAELDLDPQAAEFQAVISGHSHKPALEQRGAVLYLNPGSAGPRRFSLPVSVARLHIDGARLEATLVELSV
jgi:putative phosphoesterase